MKYKPTALENRFLIHIRTLALSRASKRKGSHIDEFVFLSIKTIRENYFQENHLEIFTTLKENNLLDFTVIEKNDHKSYKFKALQKGEYDFSLLQVKSQPLDYTTSSLKSNLRWVSIPSELEVSYYFKEFLASLAGSIDAFFIVDGFSGRVHTPITSMKSDLRKHLLIKKERTASLDIAQMQPLLLSHLLFESIGDNEYTTWINTGKDIYEMFKEKLNLSNRDAAKEKFYQITFSKPSKTLTKLFGHSTWIVWIDNIKTEHLPQNPNTIEKPHSNLAWLLQNAEVTLMRKIWERLIKNDILFLTVHDEVIVRESDKEEAIKIMESTISYHFPNAKINITYKAENQTSPQLETLKQKFAKLSQTKFYFPYELYDNYNIDNEEIEKALELGIIDEDIAGSYRLIIL